MRKIPLLLVAICLPSVLAAQAIRDFEFEVETIGGQKFTHEDFENNVLLVDYWGTWCPPCRAAIPFIREMYAKYKHHGLEIIGFSYERGDPGPALDNLREFAAKNEITYPLAIGTPALQQQVPGFRAYPTMLFFKKGLEHDHTKVGLAPGWERKMETWIRGALGLEVDEAAGLDIATEKPADDEAGGADEEQEAEEEPDPIPEGLIFKPGDHDTGFDFQEIDVDGTEIKFADLRGKPVVLAMTSSWDGEAVTTASLLNTLHMRYSADETAHVIAASLEMARQRDGKVQAIDAFRKKYSLEYRIIPAGLGFQKKIYAFRGMPLFLVFDADGRLILRESGNSPEVRQKILEAVASAVG